MSARSVRARHPAARDDIGDLVTRRPLPGPGLPLLDPFLFLNHHGPQVYPPGNRGLPFGPHPHRGFETVTLILSGSLAHLDSGGHESVIHAGGLQWMTAGSGLIHAEISDAAFRRAGGPLEILQLWVNLPARLKMTSPAYTGLQAADIPQVALDGGLASAALIAGGLAGAEGPYRSLTGVAMMVVTMAAGAAITLPAPHGRVPFFYVVSGSPTAGGAALPAWHLIEWAEDGDTIDLTADAPAVIAYAHADPIGEPVVAHGPFVMNSREEISAAIRDYQAGRFGPAPAIG